MNPRFTYRLLNVLTLVLVATLACHGQQNVVEFVFSGVCQTDADGRGGSCSRLFDVPEGGVVTGLLYFDELVLAEGAVELPFEGNTWDYLLTFDSGLSKSNQGFYDSLSMTLASDFSTFTNLEFSAGRGLAGGLGINVTESSISGGKVVSPPFYSATATGGWIRGDTLPGNITEFAAGLVAWINNEERIVVKPLGNGTISAGGLELQSSSGHLVPIPDGPEAADPFDFLLSNDVRRIQFVNVGDLTVVDNTGVVLGVGYDLDGALGNDLDPCDDLALIWAGVGGGGTSPPSCTIAGDIDFDGRVTFSDFLVLAGSFGMTDAEWPNGDFDWDGEVGFADFLLLSENYGETLVLSRGALVAPSVPEPTGLAFGLFVAMCVFKKLRLARQSIHPGEMHGQGVLAGMENVRTFSPPLTAYFSDRAEHATSRICSGIIIKRLRFLLSLGLVLLTITTTTLAQDKDTDGDGLLDLMDVEGFSPQRCHYSGLGIQDLDGTNLLECGGLVVSNNDVASIEQGDFEGLGHGLDLSSNQITNVEPGAFRGTEYMEILDLSNNLIESLAPGAFDGVSTEQLSLRDNNLEHLGPRDLEGIESVQHLSLSNNQISRIAPGIFPALEGLYLENNAITSIEPGVFRDIPWILHLQGNPVRKLDFRNTTIAAPWDRSDHRIDDGVEVVILDEMILDAGWIPFTGVANSLSVVGAINNYASDSDPWAGFGRDMWSGVFGVKEALTIDQGLFDLFTDDETMAGRVDEFIEQGKAITVVPYGDANKDEKVDFADFLVVSSNYGGHGRWSDGDFDRDQIVGFPDFLLLSANYGQSFEFTLVAVTLPEPNSLTLLLLGMVCSCSTRQNRTVVDTP